VRDEDRSVNQLTTILFCDSCETATTRSERGWRAYLLTGADGARTVEVLCPACAEAVVGEDEFVGEDESGWAG
jgi:hypothetical protein